jgi:hypothetical protein
MSVGDAIDSGARVKNPEPEPADVRKVGGVVHRCHVVGDHGGGVASPQPVELGAGEQRQRHRGDLLVGDEDGLAAFVVSGHDTAGLHDDLLW